MATIADIQAQVAAIKTTVDQIAAKTPPPPPVATQADLDTLSTDLAAIETELTPIATA